MGKKISIYYLPIYDGNLFSWRLKVMKITWNNKYSKILQLGDYSLIILRFSFKKLRVRPQKSVSRHINHGSFEEENGGIFFLIMCVIQERLQIIFDKLTSAAAAGQLHYCWKCSIVCFQ